MGVPVIQETTRINQKCEQLHPMCEGCQFLKNKEICQCPKYFNNDLDLSKILVMCGKYKKIKKVNPATI